MPRSRPTTTRPTTTRPTTVPRRLLAVLAVLLTSTLLVVPALISSGDGGESAEPSPVPPASSPTLTPAVQDALLAALDDERRAQAQYRAVLDRHGEVMPFARIVGAEGRHEAHLAALFETYGLTVPVDPWKTRSMEAPETVLEACRQGAESEKANIELYDQLLEGPLAREADVPAEVGDLFRHLRDMSRDHHLRAFTRCVERGGQMGRPGRGAGKGPGMEAGRGPGMGAGMHGGSGKEMCQKARRGDPKMAKEAMGCGAGCGSGSGSGCACGRCTRAQESPKSPPQPPAEEAPSNSQQ